MYTHARGKKLLGDFYVGTMACAMVVNCLDGGSASYRAGGGEISRGLTAWDAPRDRASVNARNNDAVILENASVA